MEKVFFVVHITGILISIFAIFKADKDGFSWFRGKKNTLNTLSIKKVHKQVWLGLILAIISGFLLFWDKREYLLHYSPGFIAKMIFVMTLTINGFFIGRFMEVATQKSFKELTLREKTPLFISGGVSTISWLGAIVSAFLL